MSTLAHSHRTVDQTSGGGGSIKYDEGDAGPSISLLIRKILSVNFLF